MYIYVFIHLDTACVQVKQYLSLLVFMVLFCFILGTFGVHLRLGVCIDYTLLWCALCDRERQNFPVLSSGFSAGTCCSRLDSVRYSFTCAGWPARAFPQSGGLSRTARRRFGLTPWKQAYTHSQNATEGQWNNSNRRGIGSERSVAFDVQALFFFFFFAFCHVLVQSIKRI